MNFTMVVGYEGQAWGVWNEPQNRSEVTTREQARDWAQACIDRFNGSLRPGERRRQLVRVEFFDTLPAHEPHNWEKKNLVTMVGRGRMYDIYKCGRCGITGKRFGTDLVVPDESVKAFEYCDTARALLEKRRAKT